MSEAPKQVTCCQRVCQFWGDVLLCIKFPIRFEDKGLWFLIWSVFFPAITFNFGFLFQGALDRNWGLGTYLLNNSQFCIKILSGNSDEITGGDIFSYSFFASFGTTGMFGTLTLWIGFIVCIWAHHAPLKYLWKQFMIIFLPITIIMTFISHLIVLGIDPNVWTNYHIKGNYPPASVKDNAMYKALGGLYNNAPWWYDPYWTYLNIVQGIVYGITQPILFYYYLIKAAQYQTQSKQWYGFYDFYSKFGFCALYGIAIFTAQIVGIQGFTPAIFFIFLWYKDCYCGICCKTNKDSGYLKYNGPEHGDPSDRGVYCCNCLPCIPCLACFLRPFLAAELALGELELQIAGDDKKAIQWLEDEMVKLFAWNDKVFGKKVGKVIDKIEEGLFEAIIEFISIDEKRHWWTYDILMKLARIRFELPEDKNPAINIADTKPYRLPKGVKQIPAGNVDNVVQQMTDLCEQGKKIKAVGSGYAWTEILGTSKEDGVFIETMLDSSVKEEDIKNMRVFDVIHEGKHKTDDAEQKNAMNGIVDYDEYKDLLLPDWRQKYDKDYLVCAEAGCNYYTLNGYTWPLPPRPDTWIPNGNINARQRQTTINPKTGEPYKMLANQPGYQGLSFGGTINVGVQGTGTQKTPEIVGQPNDEDSKSDGDSKPVYKPDRSQAPGDFIRSLTILVTEKDDETGKGKVQKLQLEPASNPIHDPTKWATRFGDDWKLIQDDDLFYGSIVSLGTIGIHVAYLFELIDASFEEEHRYIVTWDEFKSKHLAEIEKGVESGEILRWQLWLSPYKTGAKWLKSKFAKSPPVVVSTYRKTDKIPPPILTAENAGKARSNAGTSIIAGAAATWVSQVIPDLTPFILEMTLRSSVYGRKGSEHKLAVDPFAAVALGAAVLDPSIAIGNAVDYKYLVESIEAWQKFGQQSFPECPITVPTAARFSCKSNQLLALANEGPTVWYESVTLDWSQSKWPHVGKVPNGEQHLFGVNKLFHDSDTFKGRYNWGLDFNVKDNKAAIWRNQQGQISEFVEKVYKRLTYEDGAFFNQFIIDSGIHAMAYNGKSIKELIDENNSHYLTVASSKQSETQQEAENYE